MSSPRPELESAINQYSCALACLVSLARDNGVVTTQATLIKTYAPQITKWAKEPGLLNVVELFGFLRVLLNTKRHIITDEKDVIIDLLKQPDTIGGFVITKKYWDENGNLADYNHCKRITGFCGDGLELMNPKQGDLADIVAWKWDALGLWKAYSLIVQK
jgi:hypothetical protein